MANPSGKPNAATGPVFTKIIPMRMESLATPRTSADSALSAKLKHIIAQANITTRPPSDFLFMSTPYDLKWTVNILNPSGKQVQ